MVGLAARHGTMGLLLGLTLTLSVGSVVLIGCGRKGSGKVSGARLEQLIATGKLSEAETLCKKVLQNEPANVEARGSLAKILCLQGDALLYELGFFSRPDGG